MWLYYPQKFITAIVRKKQRLTLKIDLVKGRLYPIVSNLLKIIRQVYVEYTFLKRINRITKSFYKNNTCMSFDELLTDQRT